MVVGILFADFRQDFAAFPLEAETVDAGTQSFIGKHLLHMVLTVCVECAEVELDFRMVLFQCRGQILLIEADGAFGRPGATGIGRIAVSLVLVDNHVDVHALFLIGIDELAEIVGVCLKVAWVLYEVILCGEFAREFPFPFA